MLNLTKPREEYIKKITSPLEVKVNVYIDGNNLYVNLENDLNHILEIYQLAKETFELTLESNSEEEYFHHWNTEMISGKINFDKTPDKLANLSAWYLNFSLQNEIIKSVRATNAKNLLGEINSERNEIIFPREIFSNTYFIDNVYTHDLEDALSKSSFRTYTSNKNAIVKVLIKVLNSINEYKKLSFPNNFDLFINFLDKNNKIKEDLIIKLKTYQLDELKNKVLLNFKFNYYLYRAKIDIDKYIAICKKKSSIYNLSESQKKFYQENIKLLKQKKLKPSIRNNSYVVDIDFTNKYYEILEQKIQAETTYGQVAWNSFKISEKEVDSNLIIECLSSLSSNKADLHCILTNDSDYAPLFKKAKDLKKELFLCSVVPKKTVARRLISEINENSIFFIKHITLDEMFDTIMTGSDSGFPHEFNELINNEDKRKELLNKIINKISEQINNLENIKENYKSLTNRINNLIKERYE